jgi:hypothetical protein
MSPARAWSAAIAAGVAGLAAGPVWAQNPVYTRVKMSLTVPWTLYFVFLACVLIPFIVMIVLAWRSAAKPAPEPRDAAGDEPAKGVS